MNPKALFDTSKQLNAGEAVKAKITLKSVFQYDADRRLHIRVQFTDKVVNQCQQLSLGLGGFHQLTTGSALVSSFSLECSFILEPDLSETSHHFCIVASLETKKHDAENA